MVTRVALSALRQWPIASRCAIHGQLIVVSARSRAAIRAFLTSPFRLRRNSDSLSERLQKQTPILVVNEYRLPPVPAIHQVVNSPCILDSQLAWHGPPTVSKPRKHVNSHLRPLFLFAQLRRRFSDFLSSSDCV